MNNKTKNNTYAVNGCQYNKSINKTNINYINNKKPYYGNEYDSPYMIKNGDVSGTVWINNGYNVAEEDPGLSWVL